MDNFNNTFNQPTNTSGGLNMVKSVFGGRTMLILTISTFVYAVITAVVSFVTINLMADSLNLIVNEFIATPVNPLEINDIKEILTIFTNVFLVITAISVLIVLLLGALSAYIYAKSKSEDRDSTPVLGFKIFRICLKISIAFSIIYGLLIIIGSIALVSFSNDLPYATQDSTAFVIVTSVILVISVLFSVGLNVLYLAFMTKFSSSIVETCNTDKVHNKGAMSSGVYNLIIAILMGLNAMSTIPYFFLSGIFLSVDTQSQFGSTDPFSQYIFDTYQAPLMTITILSGVLLVAVTAIAVCMTVLCFSYNKKAKLILTPPFTGYNFNRPVPPTPQQNMNNNFYNQAPQQNTNNNFYNQAPQQNANNNFYNQAPQQNANNNFYNQAPQQPQNSDYNVNNQSQPTAEENKHNTFYN